jgi:hypothetical protein
VEKPSLAGCWAKIERAREHNGRLEELAEAFLKRRPNQVIFDSYSDPPWIIIRAVVEPVPIEFSTIGGDLVHNLRSALDHLAWQLVLSDGGTPGRHTSFPIYRDEADFDQRVRNPPKRSKSPLEGIDRTGPKWALVEQIQPWWPEYIDFWPVASFSNRDKHQGLLTSVSFTEAIELDELLTITGGVDVEARVVFEAPGELKHDTEIVRIRAGGGSVKMKRDPPFEITLSDGEAAMSVMALDRLRSIVVGIIRKFEGFF